MKTLAPWQHSLRSTVVLVIAATVAVPPQQVIACTVDPFPVVVDPCTEYFDGNCWVVDCGSSGILRENCLYDPNDPPPTEPPPDPPTNPGDSGGSGDPGDSETCDEEGANPISVADGNVTRRIDDLQIAGSGLVWYRYHNSIARNEFTPMWLGNGGSWRHSWQYDLVATHSPEYGEVLEFCYPAGRRVFLQRQSDGSYRAPDGNPERAIGLADGAIEFETRSGAFLKFTPSGRYGDHPRYRATQLTTATSDTYKIEADSAGRIVRVTDDEGRFLTLAYREISLKSDPHRVLATVRAAPARGQWLEIAVPAEASAVQARAFLLRAAPGAKIAEIQFLAEGSATPFVGTPYSNYGEAALDRSSETVWVVDATRRTVGYRIPGGSGSRLRAVRVLAAPGSEQALLHTRVVIELAEPPTDTISAISEVRTSDGRSVRYDYEKTAQSMGEQAVLTTAHYGDGTAARYRYSTPVDEVGGSALLVEADDPRYARPAKHIRYAYYQPRRDGVPAGTIKEEINPATGKAWARLEVDPARPTVRTVHYSDDRFHRYQLHGDGSGRIVERIDSLGRRTMNNYAPGRFSWVSERIDHAGRKTVWQRDERNRVVATRDFKGRVSETTLDRRGRSASATSVQGRTTKFTRDTQGRIVEVVNNGLTTKIVRDAKGRVTERSRPGKTLLYTHDAAGRIATVTGSGGASAQLGRDAFGQIVAITDAIGRTTRYERNERGLVTATTTPDGLRRTFARDAYGRKIAETDPLGRTARWTYDELSRLASHTDFFGRTTTYDYAEFPNGCGSCTVSPRPTRIVGPDGVATSFLYDSEGRLLARTAAVGTAAEATTVYAYDDDHLLSVTDPEGRVTRYTYDDEGHRLTATDPLGRVTRWSYDEHGRNTAITPPDGGITRFAYDEHDRRIATTDAGGNTTRFAYDPAGRMISLTDARGSVYRWEYDAAGRKTAMIYPDDSRETWTHDAIGRILQVTTRAGQVKTLSYDAQGHLASETWSANAAPNLRYTYTALGQLATLDNGLASVAHTYDAAGRMIAETVTRSGQAPLTIGYGYDGATGRRTMLTYPSGAQVSQSYNPRGDVAAVAVGGAEVARFAYGLDGRRTTTMRANGVATATTTDAAGQLLALVHTLGTATLASTAYELDVAGRRTAKIDDSGWTECYRYDAVGQLVSAEYFATPGARPPVRRVDYTYDALGNRERLAEVDRAQRGTERKTAVRYTANALNQYTRIAADGLNDVPAYDANGNLTRAQGVTYRYNARNQLIEVTMETERMTQIHDPKGRVIERRYFTRGSQAQWIEDDTRSVALVYDAAWNVIEDRDLRGRLRARYVHGPRIDEILLREGSDGAKLYPLADGLGSTVALTNAAGSVTYRYRYDAYGTPAALTANQAFPAIQSPLVAEFRFLFTGREWLGVAALQDNRHRIYSAMLGRWVQVDPISFLGGDVNLTRYVNNQVSTLLDPWGLACGSGWLDLLVPDSPAGFDFTSCCQGHDSCYGSCGWSKSECDAAFRQCMLESVCGGHEGCAVLANIYADAVVSFGGSAYRSAQKKSGCCN